MEYGADLTKRIEEFILESVRNAQKLKKRHWLARKRDYSYSFAKTLYNRDMNIYEADRILEKIASRALRWREAFDGEIPGTLGLDKTIPNIQGARTALISLAEEGWDDHDIYESAAGLMLSYLSGTKPPMQDINGSVRVLALWGYHSLNQKF